MLLIQDVGSIYSLFCAIFHSLQYYFLYTVIQVTVLKFLKNWFSLTDFLVKTYQKKKKSIEICSNKTYEIIHICLALNFMAKY